jgi:hypothetical protein
MAKPTKAHPIRDTQPYLHHDTLTQDQQAAYLGVKQETVLNLGHPVPISEIEQNPADMADYTNNDVGKQIVRGPPRSAGVFGSFKDPKSGISTNEQNLDRWADYARSNSYHGGHGEGVEPTVRDPRGGTVPSEARNKGSDGYLQSTEGWPSFDTGGADSGVGRLEKAKKY